jgi:hypothetical protein
MYLNVVATPNDRTTGVVTFERSGPDDPKITMAQAFVGYKLSDEYSLRFGQATNNFGIDAAQTSSQRIPFDRALAAEGNTLLGQRGLWWRGWYDRGIWAIRQADGEFPQVTMGVMNGQYADRSAPGLDKTVEADFKWKPSWGYFGASGMNGEYLQRTASGDAVDGIINHRKAVDFYVFKNPTPFGGQAEWINGTLPGLSATTTGDRRFCGWYLQGVYDKGGNGFPYVRFEEYDQDKDVPGIYRAWHLGYKWRLNNCNQITAQIDRGHNGNEGFNGAAGGAPLTSVIGPVDMYGLQWQMSF